MTIEKIAARHTYNFMGFDDYVIVVFKSGREEDNFYYDLIDYGEDIEWVKQWKSDNCAIDIVKRRKRKSFPAEDMREIEGAKGSYNDDWNLSARFEEVAERMKKFAWTVKVDRSAGEIVLKDLVVTYYAFAKWWKDHRCVDFEPQYGLNDREIVLKYNG